MLTALKQQSKQEPLLQQGATPGGKGKAAAAARSGTRGRSCNRSQMGRTCLQGVLMA